MSLESWKAEFYSTEAKDVPAAEAVDHSIRKWEGLRAESIAKHGVRFDGYEVRDGEANWLGIAAHTCALCAVHYDETNEDEPHPCAKCPLYIVRGNVACDERAPGETAPPYQHSARESDPEPMLVQLRLAKEAQTK